MIALVGSDSRRGVQSLQGAAETTRASSRHYAEQFGDASVVAAYAARPPYPAALDPLFVELAGGPAAHVLDLGCGTGELARRLAPQRRARSPRSISPSA